MAGIGVCSGVRAWGIGLGTGSRAIALAAALAAAAAPAPGATGRAATAELRAGEGGPAELPRLIEQLDSADFMMRQEASTAIITDDRITIKMIEQALENPDLSAEQRIRLRHIQKRRFETSDRAGMGVQFEQFLPNRVVLRMAIGGFKSAELLEPGDIIDSAGGVELRSARAFDLMRMIILSHDPGDELPVVVRRGEQTLNLRVPLGRYLDLQNTSSVSPSDMERAWRVRVGRTPDPERVLISADLSAEEWTQMDASARERRVARDAEAARNGLMNVPPHILIVGGKPRPPFFDEGEFEKLMVIRNKDEIRFEDLQLLRLQQAEQQRRIAAAQPVITSPSMSLEEEIERTKELAESARAEAEKLQQNADAGLPVDPARAEDLQIRLQIAERVLRALTAERDRAKDQPTDQPTDRPAD